MALTPTHVPPGNSRRARCPASGSLGKSLTNASAAVSLDFSSKMAYPAPSEWGADCSQSREVWKEWKNRFVSRLRHGRSRRRAQWALKSCDRLFDLPCRTCDRKLSDAARREWVDLMSTPHEDDVRRPTRWSNDPIGALKARVRELVGTSWAQRREEKEGQYVPDQQGCLENERLTGGTLGVSEEELSSRSDLVRLGVAKTKGKFRVVTMQSARVKRILSPVHNALYDYLSEFGYVVRGDVTKSDFAAIQGDLRPGEVYVSADYSAATNNLDPVAVRAVVEVLCEAVHLTSEERTTLRDTFGPQKWRSRSGREYPICKGSMMGNLVSFPVLCLINKACYDIARDASSVLGEKEGRTRKCRLNGDDLIFASTEAFFSLWKDVVSHYGLIVNLEKTGKSERYLELNSRSFDTRTGRILPKACLGFFRRDNTLRDLLGEVVKGADGFKKSTVHFIVCQQLRYEICLREVRLTSIPSHLYASLVKRKWFRNWCNASPPEVLTSGVSRSVPMIVDVPPRPSFYAVVTKLSREIQKECVASFLGKKVSPEEVQINRRSARLRFLEFSSTERERFVIKRSVTTWGFVWPRELLTFIRDRFSRILLRPRDIERKWIEDHPFLTTRMSLVKTCTSFSRSFAPPASLLVGVNVDGFVSYPNGPV